MRDNKVKQDRPEESKELALHYMTTLVEVARESFLILDSDLRVIAGNPTFYQCFQVLPERTEAKLFYELGNGQWNIPELRRLLEEILPQKKVVRDYEVTHVFETIGAKIMLLNARQIDSVQLIILAIEDISVRKMLEKKVIDRNEDLEVQVIERTRELSGRVKELEEMNRTMVGRELKMVELKKEIEDLRKQVKKADDPN